MKRSNYNSIILSAFALVAGFAIAWFIWGRGTANGSENNTEHIHTGVSKTDEIWTCSMHPQIRQAESGDCPICGMDLIRLEANDSGDPLVLEMTKEAIKLAQIQTTIIGQSKASGDKKISLSGKVKADERLASSLVSHVPGRIEKLYISFTGEQIGKGQKLAEIYSPELITAQAELLEAIKLRETNPGLLEATRNKLRYWKIGENTIQGIEDSGQIRETFPIYAGSSGIVTTKRISVGEYIKKGEVLFDLMDLSRVWVLFDVYEEDLPAISKGDQVEFTTPSQPDRKFKARIDFIDPVIDPASRTVSIRTEVSNKNQQLKPEMLVYGTIFKISKKGSRVTVPKTAVLWTGERSVVYVKVPEMDIPSFEFREIEIGEGLGESYLVLEGLEAGEEVVTNGNFSIDAAAQLNNQASMMNKRVSTGKTRGEQVVPDYTGSTPAEFKDQLSVLSKEYLKLKDAFVKTEAGTAANLAKEFLSQSDDVDRTLLTGDAHSYWMGVLTGIKDHGDKIANGSEIAEQRLQFDFLSQLMIRAIKVFGISDRALYVQHCPMAINKQGADWISDKTEIRNPYFGDQMLKCGSVTDTIKVTE